MSIVIAAQRSPAVVVALGGATIAGGQVTAINMGCVVVSNKTLGGIGGFPSQEISMSGSMQHTRLRTSLAHSINRSNPMQRRRAGTTNGGGMSTPPDLIGTLASLQNPYITIRTVSGKCNEVAVARNVEGVDGNRPLEIDCKLVFEYGALLIDEPAFHTVAPPPSAYRVSMFGRANLQSLCTFRQRMIRLGTIRRYDPSFRILPLISDDRNRAPVRRPGRPARSNFLFAKLPRISFNATIANVSDPEMRAFLGNGQECNAFAIR